MNLNPIPIDHDIRAEFIEYMSGECFDSLDEEVYSEELANEISWAFHEELWAISWELESYYRSFADAYYSVRPEER